MDVDRLRECIFDREEVDGDREPKKRLKINSKNGSFLREKKDRKKKKRKQGRTRERKRKRERRREEKERERRKERI